MTLPLTERLLAELADRCDLVQIQNLKTKGDRVATRVRVAVSKMTKRGRVTVDETVRFVDAHPVADEDRQAMAIFYAVARLHRRLGL